MPPFLLCTTLSNRDLALAGVLAQSFRAAEPGGENRQVIACIADRPDPTISYSELPFEVVFCDQLDIPGFESLAFACDRDALVAAVLPFFLDLLRRRGFDRVLWVEPDTWILDSLDAVAKALDEAEAVLFARASEPSDDPLEIGDVFLRHHGIYDHGALGLRFDSNSEALLDRWKRRTRRTASAPLEISEGEGASGRSFFEWLPGFVESIRVVRDPGFGLFDHSLDVSVEARGESWVVADRRLTWARFPGLDRASLRWDGVGIHRFRRADPGSLRPLVDAYRREVSKASGHLPGGSGPASPSYGFEAFQPTEVAIPPGARLAYRRIDPDGRRWPDPFDQRVVDSFFAYLLAPIETERGRLNRAALAMWEASPARVAKYPDVCGEDLADFVEAVRAEFGDRGTQSGDDSAESSPFAEVFLDGLAIGPGDRREPPAVLAFGGALEPYDAAVTTGARTLLDSVDLAAPGGLVEWLNEPISGAVAARPIVTRLALLLHATRLDLQADYPRPLDEDQVDYAYWFANFAETDLGVAPELVRPVRDSLPLKSRVGSALRDRRQAKVDSRPSRSDQAEEKSPASAGSRLPSSAGLPLDSRPALGVNLVGYPDSDSGLGQIARGNGAALKAAGIETTEVPLDRTADAMNHGGRIHLPQGCPHPVTLLHATADESRRELAKLPSTVAAGSFRIGYWFWEMAFFPLLFADRYSWLDEIWAPSRFCQRAFEPLSTVPVRYVPPCAPRPRPEERGEAARERFGLEPGRFYFLFAFDVWSVPERKNPQAAIEAIRWLSEGIDEPVGLILKVTRSRLAPAALARLRQQAEGLPVVFHIGEIDRGAMDTLVEASDACLSLHRSEGLGLLPIESLYLGKPVIATDYGGVTDFLDETTGYPVDGSLRRLDRDHPPYPEGAVWAEPSLETAVEAMRRCVQQPDEARRRTAAGTARVEEIYGIESAARRMAGELSRIEARLGSGRR